MKHDLAYLAGIIDAKGCFSVYKRKTKTGETFSIGLKILSAKKRLPTFVYKQVGYGHLHTYFAKHIERDIYTWELFPQDLIKFIEAILPYLKLKKDQALLMLEFNELKYNTNLNLEQKVKVKAKMYKKCRALKKSMSLPQS